MPRAAPRRRWPHLPPWEGLSCVGRSFLHAYGHLWHTWRMGHSVNTPEANLLKDAGGRALLYNRLPQEPLLCPGNASHQPISLDECPNYFSICYQLCTGWRRPGFLSPLEALVLPGPWHTSAISFVQGEHIFFWRETMMR